MQWVYRLVVDGRDWAGVRELHLSAFVNKSLFYIYIYRTKLIVRLGFELGTPTPEVQRLNHWSGFQYGNDSLKIRVCVLLYYSLRVFIYCIKYR